MSLSNNAADIVTDSEHRGVLARLPMGVSALIMLARFDRPIGAWLLFWPCAWGLALAGGAVERWLLLLWFALGAVAMRGAGCVYNDIVDRDLDRMVARTASRPLAARTLSLRMAWGWLIMLCLVGLCTLLQLPLRAQLVALASLALVAAYPFMKRITWWPQVWLGMVFGWGALVGWLAFDVYDRWLPMALLYGGTLLWIVGYDTIYALQDLEDDALAGIRSSARALGGRVRAGVAVLYFGAVVCWLVALWQIRPQVLASAALLPVAVHLAWQAATLRPDDAAHALALFRSNRFAGALMFAACFVVGTTA